MKGCKVVKLSDSVGLWSKISHEKSHYPTYPHIQYKRRIFHFVIVMLQYSLPGLIVRCLFVSNVSMEALKGGRQAVLNRTIIGAVSPSQGVLSAQPS